MDVREKTVTGMAEYIEREAAQTSCRKYSFAESYDAFAVDCILKAIPSADVAPVRHGRWVDKPLIKSFKHANIPVVECSACGIDFCDIINNHYFMYKYCPNCGAKMDGGED